MMASGISSRSILTSTQAFRRTCLPNKAPRASTGTVFASRGPLEDIKSAASNIRTSPNTPPVDEDIITYAKKMPGVTAPFPNIFDPFNLLSYVGSTNEPKRELRRWRESEITHGRVCMLAALGWLVQEGISDWPAAPFPHVQGPALTHFQQVEAKGFIFWVPLVTAIGIAEAYRVGLGWNFPTGNNFYTLRDDYEPGNLGFDPLGLLPKDPAGRKDMQSRELNNGRLAMIAVAAFVVQELVERKYVLQQLTDRLAGVPIDSGAPLPPATGF